MKPWLALALGAALTVVCAVLAVAGMGLIAAVDWLGR